jgi:hypothetical protein
MPPPEKSLLVLSSGLTASHRRRIGLERPAMREGERILHLIANFSRFGAMDTPASRQPLSPCEPPQLTLPTDPQHPTEAIVPPMSIPPLETLGRNIVETISGPRGFGRDGDDSGMDILRAIPCLRGQRGKIMCFWVWADISLSPSQPRRPHTRKIPIRAK